ncbi:TPA: hypothetical protein QFC75_002441 [Enterococcus faecium]
MKDYKIWLIVFIGIVVNILSFPTIYFHQWQYLIALILGGISIVASLCCFKQMKSNIQKILLIFGMILNAIPIIYFFLLLGIA